MQLKYFTAASHRAAPRLYLREQKKQETRERESKMKRKKNGHQMQTAMTISQNRTCANKP